MLTVATLVALNLNINVNTATATSVENTFAYEVLKGPKFKAPAHIWFSKPNIVFVYDKGTLYRTLLTKDGLILTSSMSIIRPLVVTQLKPNKILILTPREMLITNNAFMPLHVQEGDFGNVRAAGFSHGCKWYVTNTTLLALCRGQPLMFSRQPRSVEVLEERGIPVSVPLWRLEAACSINATSFEETFVNGLTYVLLKGPSFSKLAILRYSETGPRLLACKELPHNATLKNVTIVIRVGNATVLHNLLTKLNVRVAGASDAQVLGLDTSKLGYKAYVLLIKRANEYLLASVRAKDSKLLMLTSSKALLCTPFPPGACFAKELNFKPLKFKNLAAPYGNLELVVTKEFIKVVNQKSIDVTLRSFSNGKVSYTITLTQPRYSKIVQVPSDAYELDITTKVGRVVLFTGVTPPGTNFDPPVTLVEISPEIIIPYIYKLTVKVVDAQSGNPLPGAMVYISGTTVRGKTISIGPLITNAKGIVSIHLEKGIYNIKVVKTYYKLAYVTNVKLYSNRNVTVKLWLRGVNVNLQVLSKGAPPFIERGPLPDALVKISGRISLVKKTDKKGVVSVILLPGNYLLTVKARSHKPYQGVLTVPPGTTTLSKKIYLTPLLYNVTLVIKDALTGRPVIPSIVSITSVNTGKTKVIKNPASSTIAVSLPLDLYKFKVVAQNYVPYEATFNITKNVVITIPLKLKTVKVTFMVFDELKNPVPTFNITLINSYLGLKFKYSLTSKNNTISIPPGTYKLEVRAKGFEPLVTTIKITENTKVIQLTIAHKSFNVVIKAVTKDKLLYNYISYCKGTVRGGPLFEPLPLPKMTKPSLQAVVKLPRGTYVVSLTCYSATGRRAATGRETFTVPFNTKVNVPLTPTKVVITITVMDIRTNRPIPRALVKIYADKALTKLIGEGMTNVRGIARILVNSYYLGMPAWIVVTAPGYQEYKSPIVISEKLPVVYLKPAPTLIEMILGNPILLIVIVLVAAGGAYLISLVLGGRGEEEEIFEELV